MRKSREPAPAVAVEGGWSRRLRWVSLFGPRFAAVSGPAGSAGAALNNGSVGPAGFWEGWGGGGRARLAPLELPPARPGPALRAPALRTGRGSGGCALSSGCLPSGAGAALRKGARAGGRVRPVRCGGRGAQSLLGSRGLQEPRSEASCQLHWRVSLNSSGQESPLNVVVTFDLEIMLL